MSQTCVISNKNMDNNQLMRRAIALSEESVRNGGGPFGAVIARHGVIIAEASNSVTIDNDPTAHAEVNCIRRAAERLGTFDLSGCEIFTSCEPCPMCLGAIYREFDLKPADRHKPMVPLLREEGKKAFAMWAQSDSKTEY